MQGSEQSVISLPGGASAQWLHDGRVLHLHHGPSDVLVGIDADTEAQRLIACHAVADAFAPILANLVKHLPLLRTERQLNKSDGEPLLAMADCDVCQRMFAATEPFVAYQVTPMAAVAGATADYLLAVIARQDGIRKAWVNNGGDIALHLTAGQQMECGIVSDVRQAAVDGTVTISFQDGVRGVATSGQGGRSFSLGIADAVTVLAANAATADVAATLIANLVDLPGHPAITRVAANSLDPDTDLGDRHIVVDVGDMDESDQQAALAPAAAFADELARAHTIEACALRLGKHRLWVDPHQENGRYGVSMLPANRQQSKT